MDLMEDEGLKKSVIDQMMGELDGVTADSLKKSKGGPVKGVEIAITVSPKAGEEMPDGDECSDPECEIPEHHHGESEEMPEGEGSDYISQLLKKLG